MVDDRLHEPCDEYRPFDAKQYWSLQEMIDALPYANFKVREPFLEYDEQRRWVISKDAGRFHWLPKAEPTTEPYWYED